MEIKAIINESSTIKTFKKVNCKDGGCMGLKKITMGNYKKINDKWYIVGDTWQTEIRESALESILITDKKCGFTIINK